LSQKHFGNFTFLAPAGQDWMVGKLLRDAFFS
jgi:hypothetical protein